MVIVKIMGGIASQINKYNFGYELAKMMNTEFAIDISDYLDGYFRPLMLMHFNLPKTKIINNPNIIKKIKYVKNSIELKECYFNKDNIYIYKEEIDYKEFLSENPQLKINKDSEILNYLKIDTNTDFFKKYYCLSEGKETVAIHCRRGDFINLGWVSNDDKVLKSVIGSLYKENNERLFVFFSNDIKWTKENFGSRKNFLFVENNNGYYGDLEELFLMSMCKYKIINVESGFSILANFIGLRNYNSNDCVILNKILSDNTSDYSYDQQNYNIFERIPLDNNFLIIENKEKSIIQKKETEIKGNYIIISSEKRDRWKCNGLYLLATILARKNNNVLYVNINKHSDVSEKHKEEIEKDMDGKSLHFRSIYYSTYNEFLLDYKCKLSSFCKIVTDVVLPHRYDYLFIWNSNIKKSQIIRNILLSYNLINKIIKKPKYLDKADYLNEYNSYNDLIEFMESPYVELIIKYIL